MFILPKFICSSNTALFFESVEVNSMFSTTEFHLIFSWKNCINFIDSLSENKRFGDETTPHYKIHYLSSGASRRKFTDHFQQPLFICCIVKTYRTFLFLLSSLEFPLHKIWHYFPKRILILNERNTENKTRPKF